MRVTAQDLEVYGPNGVIGTVSGMTQQIAQTSTLVCDFTPHCFGNNNTRVQVYVHLKCLSKIVVVVCLLVESEQCQMQQRRTTILLHVHGLRFCFVCRTV